MASYVALGDSYSSGEADQPYTPDSDTSADQCHRSQTQAYSGMVTLPGQSTSISAQAAQGKANFHTVACSGAESIDLTQASVDTGAQNNTDWRVPEHYHYGEVNQIDESGWLDPETTLVTISIGGNDAGFADIAQGCLDVTTHCTDAAFRLTRSHDSPVTSAIPSTLVDQTSLVSYEPQLITALRYHLADVYQQIHLQAPNARILVVGYPHLFDVTAGAGCDGYVSDVQAWMNTMADDLKAAINSAIGDLRTAAPTAKISFVDPTAGFTGHGVCAGTPWITSLNLINENTSLHPTSSGQVEYGKLVNAALAAS